MFCCWKIEILSPCMYSPQIKPSLGKLKLNISFGDGLIVIRVYIMFQLKVFFFIISTKCWTALASGESRKSESSGSVLNFLKRDELSLHVGSSGHCTIRSDGSGIWLSHRPMGKEEVLILRLGFGVSHPCCQRKRQCWAVPEGLGPWDTSHCPWEHGRWSLVCQNCLCVSLEGMCCRGNCHFLL